jgi:hypothetical protein
MRLTDRSLLYSHILVTASFHKTTHIANVDTSVMARIGTCQTYDNSIARRIIASKYLHGHVVCVENNPMGSASV